MSIYVNEQHQALVLKDDPALANIFPSAPILPRDGTALRVLQHDLPTTVILRKLDYKVPNPMLHYYDWSGGKPFASQKDTCDLLTTHPRCYVLNEMGTGKTKAALWAFDYLRSNKLASRALVVSPLSTMRFTWAREAFATVPHLQVAVLHGTKKQRLERLATLDNDIYVINHDGISTIHDELTKAVTSGVIDTLIIDELAMFRNDSIRSKNMRKIAAGAKHVWGLTGSPMPREPTDVWGQCKIVTPMTTPKYFSHLRQELMINYGLHIWKPKPDAVERAYRYMQPAIRVKLDEVTELPPVVERYVDVPLGEEQAKIYKHMTDKLHALYEEHRITAANAGVALNKLVQIAGGWVYSETKGVVHLDNDERVAAAIEIIESAERKIILLAPYRHAIEGLAKKLTDAKIDFDVVHGAVHNRDMIFNKFQNTNAIRVLLAHPACLSHGLTLTAADTIIWFSPITSYETYEQTNARIRRVGQKHKQQIIHISGTAAEKRLYTLLEHKEAMQDSFLSLFEKGDL